jgi:hypothetical protein
VNFELDLRLTALRCNQPDETEEEPYLWAFFQLDGSTVRQPQRDELRLVGNVKIAAGHGGHANLSSSTAVAGQVLEIPVDVGSHRATLRPIRLQVLGRTVVIPGRLTAFIVLMDEDATSDASIVKANSALRGLPGEPVERFHHPPVEPSCSYCGSEQHTTGKPGA